MLPTGCRLCQQGAKLVLFITEKCNQGCFYCPISDKKGIFANERPCKFPADAIQEAKEMRALGAGITGGEPFLAIDKCVEYIKAFKKEFKNFHIHLYTYGTEVTESKLKQLEEAGLDEIRFHSLNNIELALKTKMQVGIEVPCIPGTEAYLRKLIDFAKKNNLFVNLNEFEFSETNWDEMEKRGFEPVDELSYAVKGSKELAEKLANSFVHFCSVRFKHAGQLTSRIKRRAETIKKPHQKITEGMLEYGLIECSKEEAKKLDLFYNEREKGAEIAIERAKSFKKKGYKVWRVLEYPCYDPWTFEKDQI